MINEKIYKAVELNDVDLVEKALTDEKLNTTSYYGARSIVEASKLEKTEILCLLLKSSANTNRESFWRRTAFMALSNAVYSGNVATAKLLLEYGAASNKQLLKKSPFLSYAITAKNELMACILGDYGFKEDNGFRYSDNTILSGEQRSDYCLEDGVYIPTKNTKDNLLIRFAREGKIKSVKRLLEDGMKNEATLDAIDAALKRNNWEMAKLISDFCHDVDFETYSECLKKQFIKAS